MGESWPRALVSLIGKNRRRYGGYIVHLAMVLLVIGVVGSSAYTTRTRDDGAGGDRSRCRTTR